MGLGSEWKSPGRRCFSTLGPQQKSSGPTWSPEVPKFVNLGTLMTDNVCEHQTSTKGVDWVLINLD